MAEAEKRIEHLLQLREGVLQEMEEADREFCRQRMRIERMESDLRIGLAEPPEYAETKGHLFPRAEARVLDAFRELLKLEEKINAARRKP
jgi:hypothetical protein